MRRRTRKKRKYRPAWYLWAGAVFIFFCLVYNALLFILPAEFHGVQKQIVVPRGATFNQVAQILDAAGVLRSPTRFSLMARLLKVTGRVQAGEYEVSTSMLPQVILGKLVTGDVIRYRLVVPEGYTVRQIAARLFELGISQDEEAFLTTAFAADTAARLGIKGKGVEGYLFPDTYLFSKGLPPIEIIQTMVARFQQVYGPASVRRAAELGMTDKQIVTLASIIEKETGAPAERPLISAVFHNRLKRGMPLCSDPTVIYGIKDFDGNLRKRDLQRMTPYNTYVIHGLPPGPIASPGEAAISAALYPAQVDYLYFVSRNDGTHQFSSTLREHNEAVWRYQKGGRRAAR
jgi:UPF0755 protein